jgi:hypothetical protein
MSKGVLREMQSKREVLERIAEGIVCSECSGVKESNSGRGGGALRVRSLEQSVGGRIQMIFGCSSERILVAKFDLNLEALRQRNLSYN